MGKVRVLKILEVGIRSIDYAEKHMSEYHFYCRKFFEALTESNKSNKNVELSDLLRIEENLTKYSDRMIIILESNSAIAELGAFTIKELFSSLVMVVNDTKFKDASSFISLGPSKRLIKSLFWTCYLH
ncbi:MAG: hypothetical protein U5J63_13320 [Fodinibius sp.]|nr:hypothetical protein [Fodinibius sp.]